VVLDKTEKRIKEKIERMGIPLKDWDVKINYGIKTGFNYAFIISSEKRDELIEKCPEADSIIRPFYLDNIVKCNTNSKNYTDIGNKI
jgi:adenine-specific DNA-methyltransferase